MSEKHPNVRMIQIACPWPDIQAEAGYMNPHSTPPGMLKPYRITFDRYQSLIIIPQYIREAVEDDIDEIFRDTTKLGQAMWAQSFTTAMVRINQCYEQHKHKQLVDDARDRARSREFNRNLIREFEAYRDLVSGKYC